MENHFPDYALGDEHPESDASYIIHFAPPRYIALVTQLPQDKLRLAPCFLDKTETSSPLSHLRNVHSLMAEAAEFWCAILHQPAYLHEKPEVLFDPGTHIPPHLMAVGLPPAGSRTELRWLIRTQDPATCWKIGPGSRLVRDSTMWGSGAFPPLHFLRTYQAAEESTR